MKINVAKITERLLAETGNIDRERTINNFVRAAVELQKRGQNPFDILAKEGMTEEANEFDWRELLFAFRSLAQSVQMLGLSPVAVLKQHLPNMTAAA